MRISILDVKCPPLAAMKTHKSFLEAADLFLALVPETLNSKSGVVLEVVDTLTPHFGTSKIEDWTFKVGFSRETRGFWGRQENPHERWKHFIAHMSMVLLCDNFIITSSKRSLYWKMPVHFLSQSAASSQSSQCFHESWDGLLHIFNLQAMHW